MQLMPRWETLLLAGLPSVAALLAFIGTIINSSHVKNLHIQINSRMDQLLKVASQAARGEGVAEGRAASIVEENNRKQVK